MIRAQVSLALVAVVAWLGCSDEPRGSSGSGGASTTTTSGSTGGAGTRTGTGTGSPSGTPAGSSVGTPTGQPSGCEPPAPAPSGGACIAIGMGQGGSGAIDVECNPITGEPCPADLACDLVIEQSAFSGFQCYPPPNTVAVCGACDSLDGPFCNNGLTCISGLCRKYCCDDDNCGPGAGCDTTTGTYPGTAVGVCLPP
jgi:hypothetical protein